MRPGEWEHMNEHVQNMLVERVGAMNETVQRVFTRYPLLGAALN